MTTYVVGIYDLQHGQVLSHCTMLRFVDTFREAEQKTPLPFIANQHLTNAVLHSSADATHGAGMRCRFWSEPIPRLPPSAMLSLVTNDETNALNSRVDTSSGRFLSFSRDRNHIRAGKHSPADAVLSIYQYYLNVLFSAESHHLVYPCYSTVPNIVATGIFTDCVHPQFADNGLVSSSNKFPGYAIALPTGATPVVYPGKTKTGKKFIVPGMFGVTQAIETLRRLHKITHPHQYQEAEQVHEDGNNAGPSSHTPPA